MPFESFLIRAEEGEKPGAKTRTFKTWLLGYLAADRLWDAPHGNRLCPVFLAYFGTDQEVKAFTANLRSGRRAQGSGPTFEIPKKAPLRWLEQAVPGGVVVTAYLPQLFHLAPTSPFVEGLRFVFAPPRWWEEAQAEALRPDFGDDAREAARAALFTAFLDRRTAIPIPPDLGFHLRLYRAALVEPWTHPAAAGPDVALRGDGLDACGLCDPFACAVSADTLTAFLTHQIQLYLEEEQPYGTPRVPPVGRLLPYPDAAPVQLCLDFALA